MNFFSLFGRFVLAIALLGQTEFPGFAQDLGPEQIRAAMQSEREKIISGEFSATFRSKTTSSSGVVLEERRGEWNVRFDYSMGWFLLDSVYSKADGSGAFRTFYYEDKSSYFTYKQVEQTAVFAQLYKKGDPKSSPDASLFEKLDVRGLGFFNTGDIISNSNRGDRIFFEHYYVKKHSAEVKTASESNDIRKLWFDHAYDDLNVQICLWVDQSKDFIPIGIVARVGDRLAEESVNEWKRLNGVMVPKRLTSISHITFIPDGKEEIEKNLDSKTEEAELDIIWKSLNENVGESERVDYRSFSFPKGTRVFLDGKLEYIYGIELPPRK